MSVVVSRLRNGLTVVSLARADVETVSLGLWVGAGSRSEDLPEQPERLEARLGQEERLTVLPNDYALVAQFIASHARARTDGRKAANKARTGVGA